MAYWMSAYTQAAQPFCDEPLIAAHTFQAAGGFAAGIRSGLLMGWLTRRDRRELKDRSGGLPDTMLLAVGPTKVYVFEYRTRGLSLALGPPVRVWHRLDLEVTTRVRRVASELTIDVVSTGEHHELESTSMTGRLGKMTREMFRLLDQRPPVEGQGSARAQLGRLADEIEAELRRLGTWREDAPSEEKVLAGGAFGMNTVAFDTWLQVVFVERLRQVARGELDIPLSSSVGTQATREYDGDPADRSVLMKLIHEVDRTVNHLDR